MRCYTVDRVVEDDVGGERDILDLVHVARGESGEALPPDVVLVDVDKVLVGEAEVDAVEGEAGEHLGAVDGRLDAVELEEVERALGVSLAAS